MLELPNDVIIYIFNLLSDKDKLKLCYTCKKLYIFLHQIKFTNYYKYERIKDLPYFNNFRAIELNKCIDLQYVKKNKI